jgi:hypothetical protein
MPFSAGNNASHFDLAQLPEITELPDPLQSRDGRRIETREAWAAHRQALLELVVATEYGLLPPDPGNVSGTERASRPLSEPGATEIELMLSMGPEQSLQMPLILTLPPGNSPFPVIVRGDLCWGGVLPEIVATVVGRGYALAQFDRTGLAPDSAERGGVYAAYPDTHCGRIAAWAWGYHRVVDYLLSRSDVDGSRIAVTGHSRGGKAALLAGATDTRIALTAPNNSGCGGAGCFRLQAEGSEDLGAILKNFPFWFHPDFGAFIGRERRLPFDQHTLKALVAPRALLSTEALGDLWANPWGSQQTHLAARKVYEFLGAADRIGIVFRPGGHEHNLADWNALLDFADAQWYGRPVARRFDALAFD